MEILQFVAGMPLGYYAAAALIGLGVWLWKRRRVPALLAAYAFFLLSLAVLARESAAERQYALRLFWSYADLEKQGLQILANIGVFVPLGLLLGLEFGWKGLPLGAGFSVAIELLQLLTARGLFEFDDMVHNTLGTLIGVALAVLIVRRRGKDPPAPACAQREEDPPGPKA
ncbi:MAG: VanZ family protein [Oscillospiraceae bacterium]|nr:VanZ family protein [Oscillospiraceae bacterium]